GRSEGYGEAWPQQVVRIRKLHCHLGRLRLGIELVAAGDETPLVRILVARRQDEPELPLPGDLLKARDGLAALKIHRRRSLADDPDRIQLDDGRQAALVTRLPGDVRALPDQGPA